ncbi:MAG TPA: biopolymer transporter ExbD [Myxococcota bacterium]|nr:biopolymer transporter ExbD [Myxococcota bacterium]HRY96559.1 biopolymer transporter ExbD [Myxococcota bacterium]
MASVSAPGGRGHGKKPLNVELNLVPFIDLLTCLICFLLMAAVWIQIGKISVAQAGQGPSPDVAREDPLSPSLVVAITPQSYLVTGNGQPLADILKRDDRYDTAALGRKLHELHGLYPDKSDIVVMSEDSVAYQDLIDVMDVCLASSFPRISVSSTL